MSQRIKERVREHVEFLGSWSNSNIVIEELYAFILSEIEQAKQLGYDSLNRLAHGLAEQVNIIKHNQSKIMVDQKTIDASLGRLETDVHNLIAALPGNTVPSTPDTVVTAALGRVDGLSTAAEAALAGVSSGGTPPAPAPAPTP